jgi:phosphocarrier protein
MTKWIFSSITITHDVGLHARPSVKLTKLAKGFISAIEVAGEESGPWIDAKSIVKVMALKARQHSTLHVRAKGPDAAEALAAVVGLIARDFEEVAAHGARP